MRFLSLIIESIVVSIFIFTSLLESEYILMFLDGLSSSLLSVFTKVGREMPSISKLLFIFDILIFLILLILFVSGTFSGCSPSSSFSGNSPDFSGYRWLKNGSCFMDLRDHVQVHFRSFADDAIKRKFQKLCWWKFVYLSASEDCRFLYMNLSTY